MQRFVRCVSLPREIPVGGGKQRITAPAPLLWLVTNFALELLIENVLNEFHRTFKLRKARVTDARDINTLRCK